MKKSLVILIVLLVTALAAMPVLALGSAGSATTAGTASAGSTTATGIRPSGTLAAAFRALRESFVQLRDQIRAARLQNRQLQLENRSLRLELRTRLTAVRKDLTPEVLAQLKEKNQSLKALLAELADTRGTVQAILDTFRKLIGQGDWSALRSGCEQILAILKTRGSQLTQINQLLKDMLKLIQ